VRHSLYRNEAKKLDEDEFLWHIVVRLYSIRQKPRRKIGHEAVPVVEAALEKAKN
jgi:hypothetical protein